MLDTRDQEQAVLFRCLAVVRSPNLSALDAREANVFRLAAMVIQSRHPAPSGQLMQASQTYLKTHPADLLSAADVLRRGWVSSLPRLRDMLFETFGRT